MDGQHFSRNKVTMLTGIKTAIDGFKEHENNQFNNIKESVKPTRQATFQQQNFPQSKIQITESIYKGT